MEEILTLKHKRAFKQVLNNILVLRLQRLRAHYPMNVIVAQTVENLNATAHSDAIKYIVHDEKTYF